MLKTARFRNVLLLVSLLFNIYMVYDYFSKPKIDKKASSKIKQLEKEQNKLNIKYKDLDVYSNILKVKDSIQNVRIDSMRKVLRFEKTKLTKIKKTIKEIETGNFRNIDNDSIINVLKRTRF